MTDLFVLFYFSDLCWSQADLPQYHLHPFHRTVVGNCQSCLTSHLPQPTELHPCLCPHFPLRHMHHWIQGTQCRGTEKIVPLSTLREIYFEWLIFFVLFKWMNMMLIRFIFLRFRSCFRRCMVRFSVSSPPLAWREETSLRIWSSTRLLRPLPPKRKLVKINKKKIHCEKVKSELYTSYWRVKGTNYKLCVFITLVTWRTRYVIMPHFSETFKKKKNKTEHNVNTVDSYS